MKIGRHLLVICAAATVFPFAGHAQDRLQTMPGSAQFQRMAPTYGQVSQQIAASRVSAISWSADGRGLDYSLGGRLYHLDFATRRSAETGAASANGMRIDTQQSAASTATPLPSVSACVGSRERGRQFESALSPD